jgi:hypothetical protein
MLVEVFKTRTTTGFMHGVADYPNEFVQEIALALMHTRCHASWPTLAAKLGDWMEPVDQVDLTVENN